MTKVSISKIKIDAHSTHSLETLNINATETTKKEVEMKDCLNDLKKETTVSMMAIAKSQLLCFNTKNGIFQRMTING